VLIEPMLWPRFFIHDGHISTSVHVDGPEPGDLVVVTAQAVAADRGPSHDHGPGRGVGAYPLLWGCVQISSASEDFWKSGERNVRKVLFISLNNRAEVLLW
jgi:hypothetical protein